MSTNRRSPAARIPPPLLFLIAFLVGLLVQRQLLAGSDSSIGSLRAIGIAMTGIALALALWAVGLFATSRTTIIPHRASSSLVVRGPYRLTRNPMYISMTLLYVGAALWTHAWAALPLLVVPLVVIDRAIIPMEETQLQRRFGDSYAAYCRRVRRWL